jgi:hypothetical protein
MPKSQQFGRESGQEQKVQVRIGEEHLDERSTICGPLRIKLRNVTAFGADQDKYIERYLESS